MHQFVLSHMDDYEQPSDWGSGLSKCRKNLSKNTETTTKCECGSTQKEAHSVVFPDVNVLCTKDIQHPGKFGSNRTNLLKKCTLTASDEAY